jgi:hypothetical protein
VLHCAHLARKLFKSAWPPAVPAALLPPARLSASYVSTVAGIHTLINPCKIGYTLNSTEQQFQPHLAKKLLRSA